VDITQLILDDHHEQRRRFAILEQVDPADTATLSAIWARLSTFLEVHAAAEEEIFYPHLVLLGRNDPEAETLDAIGDHNDIRDAIAAVAAQDAGTPEWYAAVAAVNLANGDHMAEEEREGLTDFRRTAGLRLRHDLAAAFAAFEARNFAGVLVADKDPAEYLQRVEEQAGSAEPADQAPAASQPASRRKATGSLGVGSLKGR
jgi:hypothetical protein